MKNLGSFFPPGAGIRAPTLGQMLDDGKESEQQTLGQMLDEGKESDHQFPWQYECGGIQESGNVKC